MTSEEDILEKKKPSVKLWYPKVIIYDALKVGSIDGTDTEPHDKGIIRAINANYKPNNKVTGLPERTIFVARLSPKTTENFLLQEFSNYGRILKCRLVRDIVTNFSKCYAFIEFEREDDAAYAVRKADKIILDGKMILVDFECERLLPGWAPRRLGGGFGGYKESGQLRFGGKDKPFVKPISLMDEYELKRQFNQRKQRSTFN